MNILSQKTASEKGRPRCKYILVNKKLDSTYSNRIKKGEWRNVTMTEFAKEVKRSAFKECTTLQHLTLSDSIKVIKSKAFYGCTDLWNVKFSPSLTTIKAKAFYGCRRLEKIELPASVSEVGKNAFYGCYHEIHHQTDVQQSKKAFSKSNYKGKVICTNGVYYGCRYILICRGYISAPEKKFDSKLEQLDYNVSRVLGINDTSYKVAKFQNKFSNFALAPLELLYVDISNEVTEIKKAEFRGCEHLQEVNLPDSIASIGNKAFYHCALLNNVTIETSASIKNYDSCRIGASAFEGCKHLEKFILPKKLASIEDRTFYGCRWLSEIEIPESTRSIGKEAFSECIRLKKIKIPEAVESIGKNAFKESGISCVEHDTTVEKSKILLMGSGLKGKVICRDGEYHLE